MKTETDNFIHRVRALEAKRTERGYKPGWLYYECKKAGLLETYQKLKKQGLSPCESWPQAVTDALTPRPLLTIELVPKTCWFSNVRSEVSKADWEVLKKVTFSKAEYRCEACGGRGSRWPVECHEIWHYDDTEYLQTLIGLTALCPSCHEVKHRGLANVKGRGDIADRHLAQVNGWTIQQTQQYVEDQFQVWLKRSQYDWKLNISWLNQFDIEVRKK
jgi:hypothetical protein